MRVPCSANCLSNRFCFDEIVYIHQKQAAQQMVLIIVSQVTSPAFAIERTSVRDGVSATFRANADCDRSPVAAASDRKSTRLNSSHLGISYAVFCLKKKITMELRI